MPTADREINVCNFRDSGLLSNESTRYLRGLHEGFARSLSHSLDLFLGVPLELKLDRVEQVGLHTVSGSLTVNHYLLPLSLVPLSERAVVCLERRLLFRLLDLLLGGSGEVRELEREITEIDEELFRCVMDLVCVQLERTWKDCAVSVALSPSIKRATLEKLFAAEERLLELRFVLQLGDSKEDLVLLLPATFGAALVQSNEMTDDRSGGNTGEGRQVESRLLQCRMKLSVDLCGNIVPLGELVALREGSILDLRTSADTPIQLRVDGYPVFEVRPVKNNRHKAAQIVRPLQDEGRR